MLKCCVSLGAGIEGERELGRALGRLLDARVGSDGRDSLSAMSATLAEVLGAAVVLVGELDRCDCELETVALWADGGLQPNLIYKIEGTPCAGVVTEEEVRVFTHDVVERFPEDEHLREMNVGGYVGVPLFDSHGRVMGLAAALFRDRIKDASFASTVILVFASRAAAELERRRLRAELVTREERESVAALASGVMHKLNNHLMSIMGSVELLMVQLPPDHPSRALLELAERNADEAGALCQQLLAHAGADRQSREELQLSAAVRSVDGLLRAVVSRNIGLRFELADNLPKTAANLFQLQQALLSLVMRASRALGEREGAIVVRTGCTRVREPAPRGGGFRTLCQPGWYLELEVADDGPEIPACSLSRLFDPRDASELEGAGLGPVRGLVERCDGSVSVSSRSGSGTSIRVLLPVCARAVQGASEEKPGLCSAPNRDVRARARGPQPSGRN